MVNAKFQHSAMYRVYLDEFIGHKAKYSCTVESQVIPVISSLLHFTYPASYEELLTLQNFVP
jgi:hypothetical protein